MKSIVLDLQKDAMNSNIELSDLLRKAYVVAKKLKIKELENWVRLELNGYGLNDNRPEYRKVHGSLKFFNPLHGYCDYVVGNTKIRELASSRYLYHPIAELEDLYKRTDNSILWN